MYSLDINFLKDRDLVTTSETTTKSLTDPSALADKAPIAIGAAVALIFPALMFGYLKRVEAKTAELEGEIQQTQGEIAKLSQENSQLDELKQQVETAKAETQAFVSVFEKLTPWAAILQEVSDRTPPGVRVDSLQQTGAEGEAGINLAGVALSYDDVNDFVLFLERSPFFDSRNTKLNGASTTELAVNFEDEPELPENASLVIPQGVKYTIFAQLSDTPTSQLIQEINNKGSVGVVTRLKTLERQGAIAK
ncbi:PilN domain-containing protein [Myxosarcina sp. GI1]|uniref:PilN domain-containing protein n=1 Tax=Myxosarcina sp. GI1 TaxID=1541065 RepID=UPI000563D750|nr:PilN domain-containing protein [Myxosarcina sp. GI1]